MAFFNTLKDAAVGQAMKFASSPRVTKLVSDPRLMNAAMKAMSFGGAVKANLDKATRLAAGAFGIATQEEVASLRSTIQTLEDQVAALESRSRSAPPASRPSCRARPDANRQRGALRLHAPACGADSGNARTLRWLVPDSVRYRPWRIDRTPPLGLDLRSLPGFAVEPIRWPTWPRRSARAFERPATARPCCPQVALEVQRSANSPNATFASVAAILEKDAMLTARVLRLARSPAYARAIGVRSIREAVGRLGLKAVTELVWRAALDIGVFRSTQHRRTLDLLRRHSTVTAYLARTAALFTPVPIEYAFLAGLVHDIGLARRAHRAVRGAGRRHCWPSARCGRWRPCTRSCRGWWRACGTCPRTCRLAIAQHHRLGETVTSTRCPRWC